MTNDPYADLLERLDHPPLNWTPLGVPDGMNPDDCVVLAQIVGEVKGTETRESEFGPYPAITILTPEGQWVLINAWDTVLKGRLGSVEVGQIVAVRYVGEKSPKGGGNPYHDYTVAVG